MPEFPRGWSASVTASVAGGSNIHVPIPSSPGVTRVLDAVTATVWNPDKPNPFLMQVFFSTTDGAFVNFPLMAFYLPPPGADNAPGMASDSRSGLELMAGPGVGFTVGFSLNPVAAHLFIQGYDF